MSESEPLHKADYERLLALRTGLRRFLHWSEEQAKATGLAPAQHQLLLAIKGHPGDRPPSVGELADHLVLRPHSAVGLIDRAQAAGLVAREPDREHSGTVRLRLTESGERHLAALATAHLAEAARLAPAMQSLWDLAPTAEPGARDR